MSFPLDSMKLFPLGGCATCGVNVEVRPGCRLCRECLVIADVIYDEVRREEHRARGGSNGNYHLVDPEARWPVDENGVGPFGWRSDKRAAVGVTCNVCRRQPEARAGLRMCRSCLRLAADLARPAAEGPQGAWVPGVEVERHPLRATQNPLPTDPPQVPENTPAAEPPADPTQNDPIASAADEHGPFPADPDHCSSCKSGIPRFFGRDPTGAIVDIVHAIEPEKFSTGALMWQQQCTASPARATGRNCSPTFNHTRGDSSLTPCPICAKAMGAELGREIGQLAVEAAEAAEATCVTCGHRTESHITSASGSLHCWCGCKNFGLAL